jgi:GDP-L-fucose synthase
MIERTRQYKEKYNRDIRFIMLGTVCAYPKFASVPFKEEELWNGYPEETNAPYGVAKKALMLLGKTYHEQYGMNIVNLIPVNMYGPYDHFNLTSSHVIPALILKVYNAMKNGDKCITLWGTGQVSREFLYAGDCVEAIHAAIHADVGPEPTNIGTGKEIKICDLITEIAEQMGYEGEIIYDSSKPDGQPRRCLDTSKAKERLGFVAQTSLEEGLKQTIQWFLGEQK